MDAILIGHSFVRRLQKAYLPHSHQNIDDASQAEAFAHALQVNEHYCGIYTYCHNINVIQDISDLFLFIKLLPRRPNIAVIDFGSNDLAQLPSINSQFCLSLASAIFECAQSLTSFNQIETVIIHSVLPRIARIRSSPELFRQNLDSYNHYLKQFCDTESKIHYQKLRGFFASGPSTWSHDGIHFHEHSMPKYLMRMRHSLIFSANKDF